MCVCVKIIGLEKPLVIISHYGVQSRNGYDFMIDAMREVGEEVDYCSKKGYSILWCGDQNAWVGDKINGNCIKKNVTGRLMMEIIERNNMEIVNNRIDDGTTFSDPVSKVRRALDIVVCNDSELIKEIVIDELPRSKRCKFTPYSWRWKRRRN